MSESVEDSEKSSLEKLIEEQLTPRTQYGLVVLFAISMIYSINWLMGYVELQSERAQALNAELEIWSDSDAQTAWRERSEVTAETLKDWESAAWQAESPGIASAEIEIAIQSIASEANVPAPRIDVNAESATQQSMDFLRFDVSGNVPIGNIPRLLVLFGAHRKKLIVTDVQLVTRNQSTTNFQISGIVPFKRAITAEQP